MCACVYLGMDVYGSTLIHTHIDCVDAGTHTHKEMERQRGGAFNRGKDVLKGRGGKRR